jgi:hypothetical protein
LHYGLVPVSECRAWKKELEERAVQKGLVTREELEAEKPHWHGWFLDWNSELARERRGKRWKAVSRHEHVGRHAKMLRQGADVIERELAFAAQNHHAQRAMNAQQSSEVGRFHAVRVQEVL